MSLFLNKFLFSSSEIGYSITSVISVGEKLLHGLYMHLT
jgi:hypothetical protein